MKIEFESEGGTTYAVAKDQRYQNRIHEELLYAEIAVFGNGYVVRWNDNFFSPEPFSNLEEAKQTVVQDHSHHEPQSNGKSWV